MKKRRALLLLFLLHIALISLYSEALLFPGDGMFTPHSLTPSSDSGYKDFISAGSGLSSNTKVYDSLGLAVCSSNRLERRNRINTNSFQIEVNIDELMFVSDSNPVYKRPLELAFLERAVEQNTWETPKAESDDRNEAGPYGNGIRRYGLIDGSEYFPENNDYRWVWCDIVLQLPGDAVEGGVQVGSTFYPLIQGSYTATFDIPLTNINTGEKSTMTVVVPGYYSLSNTAPAGGSAALSVTPTANAGNLNLQNMLTNDVTALVGTVDFMASLEDSGSSDLDDGNEDFYIFLSASSDPFESDPNGFKLVHESFIPGESAYTGKNSIDYVVEMIGDGDHSGLAATFDGTDNFDVVLGPTKSLETICHKVANYQTSKLEYQIIPPVYEIDLKYRHFHTFSGDLIVRLEDRTTSEIPNKGRYSSNIYIHVISGKE